MNLKPEEQVTLMRLQEILEKEVGKRLSFCEVVRRSLNIAYFTKIADQQ